MYPTHFAVEVSVVFSGPHPEPPAASVGWLLRPAASTTRGAAAGSTDDPPVFVFGEIFVADDATEQPWLTGGGRGVCEWGKYCRVWEGKAYSIWTRFVGSRATEWGTKMSREPTTGAHECVVCVGQF